ncbi:MAG: 2Fe-2S iron-sulfur cluster-binding protein [Acidimicrobiales bacterium]
MSPESLARNAETDRFTCTVVGGAGGDVAFPVAPGRPVLDSLVGRPSAPIDVGCRGGGCGVCRVRILDGAFETRKMSRRHVSERQQADRYALACRLLPLGNLVVQARPPGKDRS